ncbi:S-layer homology domain-containing protein [Paenibacillus sp. KS-LC4]|uniref:S-layer homology domain-containing protein n=1 Tax=Paenibacillus sp. KS-LC4 TaxID=2979727 RepID=UPI0030D21E04
MDYSYTNRSGLRGKFSALLALLLVLALLLPALPKASAAPSGTPSVRVGTVAGAPGAYIDVPVFFDSYSSDLYVYRSDVAIHYDPNVLEPVSGEEAAISGLIKAIDSNAQLIVDTATTGSLKLKLTLTGFIEDSSELFTLRFKIKEGAPAGDSALTLVQGQLYEDVEPVSADLVHGKVTVSPSGNAAIAIGSASIKAGEEGIVSVPVKAVTLDKAIASYGIRIKFDPQVMSYNGIEGQGLLSHYNNAEGWLFVTWLDVTGGDNPIPASQDAQTLFTINFAVADDAPIGDHELTVEMPNDVRELTFTDVHAVEMNKTFASGRLSVVIPPAAPASVAATSGDSKIMLAWPAVPMAETYKVYIYEGEAGPDNVADWVEIAANVDTNAYTAEGLINGTSYVFAVKTVNLAGESVLSPASEAVAPVPLPKAPTNFDAVPGSGTAVISFAKPTDTVGESILKYRIEAVLNNAIVSVKEVPESGESLYSASFDNLSNGTTYTIRIYAVNVVGDSSPLIGTVRPVAKPLAPAILAVASGNGQVQVTLGAPANVSEAPVDNYIVTSTPGDISVTVGGDQLSAVVTGLTNGTSYTFKAVAQNAAGMSDSSAASQAAIPTAPISGGGGSGGGEASTSTSTEQIKVDVSDGSGKGGVVATTTIVRTTLADGRKKDEVTLSLVQAEQAVKQLKETGSSTARIVIPDEKDEVSDLNVKLQAEAAKQFAAQGIDLQIWTNNGGILIPSGSLQGLQEEVFFHIVPIKAVVERKQVEERIKGEPILLQLAAADGLQLIGRPMTIETNMSSRKVTLELPVGEELPSAELEKLGVFIEHSDGTKEWVKGERVGYNGTDKPGIRFTITKFSTFSIVKLNEDSLSHTAYIQGYSDGTFRPNQAVRRVEMAALLARALPKMATVAAGASYTDLPSAAWAKQAITQATAQGYMQGSDGRFMPEKLITRAEMAVIVDRLLKDKASAGDAKASFKDTNSHWAVEAIGRVSAAGIMSGSGSGLFRPNDSLTRAEAVVILNRVLERGPLTGEEAAWKDVPTSHWAFGHIQEASTEHRSTRSSGGGEQSLGNN